MADSAEGAGFWLPSEFFDDFLVDKENLDKNQSADSETEFFFPTEFPYDLGTKRDERLENPWVMSTSPQSTLTHMGYWTGRSAGGSGNGSPNGFPSPPSTPSLATKNDAVGDLIYLTAGQVAKLKLNGGDVPVPTRHKGLLGPPKNPNPTVIHNIYLQNQKQGSGMWYSEAPMCQMRGGTVVSRVGQDAWPVLQNSARIDGTGARAALLGSGGGAAVKRECAGTGVFLPRRYRNNVCKRPGYSAASIPNRNVHSMNKNLDNTNGFPQSQPYFQPKFSRGLVSDYDFLMARRNAILLQHRRSLLLEGSTLLNHGMYLPQDWTFD